MPELNLGALLRPELSELTAYLPELGSFSVRLDANEAPPLLGREATERLAQVAAETAWERYPDPTARELRATIAARCGVSPEEVLVGVGSDELITLLLTALDRPKRRPPANVVTLTPTFVMYKMSARARGLRVVEVPLDAAWDLADESVLRALEMAAPNLVFIASPNNPTGTMATLERLRRVVEAACDAVVVVDEAYVDYAARDQLPLYREYPNVVVLRTLSKIGFASLRVGWLLGRPELVRELDKVRLPYNLGAVSQRLGALVLGELADEVAGVCRRVVEERQRLARELARMSGVQVTPSEANFLWIKTERAAAEVFAGLCQRGVLVRSFHQSSGRLSSQLRVTVGTRAEDDAFLAALREVA
jgi:histidinol-phosphate aminotransferase